MQLIITVKRFLFHLAVIDNFYCHNVSEYCHSSFSTWAQKGHMDYSQRLFHAPLCVCPMLSLYQSLCYIAMNNFAFIIFYFSDTALKASSKSSIMSSICSVPIESLMVFGLMPCCAFSSSLSSAWVVV